MLIKLLLDGRWSLLTESGDTKSTRRFSSFQELNEYAEKQQKEIIERRKKEGKTNGKYFYKHYNNLEKLKNIDYKKMEKEREERILNLGNKMKAKYFSKEYKIELEKKKLQLKENRIKMDRILNNEKKYEHFIKDFCVVCKNKIPKKFTRYLQSGNYCSICCSKITKKIEEKDYESSTEIINILQNSYAQFQN